MEPRLIAADVADQFDRAFGMMRDIVENISDKEWREGTELRFVPARWAYHSLISAAFYIRLAPDEFDWNAYPNWSGPVDQLPSRQDHLSFLAEVAADYHRRWDTMSDEEMLLPTHFPWTGKTRLGQCMYNLRHFIYHLGEVAMRLRQAGRDEMPWR
jgi:uncharacterized damage-inducible protein DinB